MSPTSIQRALKGIIRINLEIEVLTGLLIRMPVHAQLYRIGGADLYPIVTKRKYTVDNQNIEIEVPVVPGSSLKGRMRSLLELARGKALYSTDRRIWLHARTLSGDKPMDLNEMENDIVQRCEVDEVFGAPAIGLDQLADEWANYFAKSARRDRPSEEDKKKAWDYIEKKNFASMLAVTRLLVDDMYPTDKYVRELSENGRRLISIADFLEEKSENRIDRISSAADPRQVVRVKPNVIFGGAMKLLVFDIDKGYVKRNLEVVAGGLKLVEETYLGASGSRGYGRVKFRNLRVAAAKANEPAVSYQEVESFNDVDGLLLKVDELANKIEGILFQ
jgi:CRISPR-associated protein Csm3